jgi:hypothetical protein
VKSEKKGPNCGEKKGLNCDERAVPDTEIPDFRFLNHMRKASWRVGFLPRK